MKTEQRTFDHPAQVISVARYSKAERNGLIVGDLILSFGAQSPTELIENPEMAAKLKSGEWLLMVRGGVAFRLAISEGLDGCTYEATTPAENITMPSSGATFTRSSDTRMPTDSICCVEMSETAFGNS